LPTNAATEEQACPFGGIMDRIILHQDCRVVVTRLPKKNGLQMDEHLVQGDLPLIEFRKKEMSLEPIDLRGGAADFIFCAPVSPILHWKNYIYCRTFRHFHEKRSESQDQNDPALFFRRLPSVYAS
jgi:hypothetical protein